jgi:hypothetical protein
VSESLRRTSIEGLRAALQTYRQTHEGKFPAHDFVAEIPDKVWQSPDALGTRYVYFGDVAQSTNIVACEPMSLGDKRFVLFADGQIAQLSTQEIRNQVHSQGAQYR